MQNQATWQNMYSSSLMKYNNYYNAKEGLVYNKSSGSPVAFQIWVALCSN